MQGRKKKEGRKSQKEEMGQGEEETQPKFLFKTLFKIDHECKRKIIELAVGEKLGSGSRQRVFRCHMHSIKGKN
jgi:hypothetical protein